MNPQSPFTGSWQSVHSSIPDHQPGNEWLHFSAEGDHVWEIGQPEGKGRSSMNRVTLKPVDLGYRLRSVRDGVESSLSARLDRSGPDEIVVVPDHGFATVFARVKHPNQSPRQNR